MVTLKNLLQGTDGIDFTIDYIEPLKDHKKKDGGIYQAHAVKLRTTSNGEIYDTKFFPMFAETVQVGDTVRATLNDKGYPDFRKVSIGEPRNNTREVRKERAIAQQRDETVIGMILHGFMSAALSDGKTPVEAGRIALEAYGIHKQSVDYIMNK